MPTKEKELKIDLAKKARKAAFEALDLASMQHRLNADSTANWARLILSARSKADLDNLASILENVRPGANDRLER